MSDPYPNDLPQIKRDTMVPHGDRVLLRMEDPVYTGKLIIPRGANFTKCWYAKVLAKGKGKNADVVPLDARVLVKKMFLMQGSMAGLGANGYECSEHDMEHGNCLLIDAGEVLAVVE
jgi:co-chaperonin GroES (HSP10)